MARRDQCKHQKAFLAAYAECGNITLAAKMAKIDRTQHYRWLADPDYAEQFQAAEEQAVEMLEKEARRRAIEGLKKKKFDKNGQPIIDPETGEQYVEHEYSDTLLIFLLKGARPEKYRDRHEISANVNVTAKLEDFFQS
jgi:hypothetical protein